MHYELCICLHVKFHIALFNPALLSHKLGNYKIQYSRKNDHKQENPDNPQSSARIIKQIKHADKSARTHTTARRTAFEFEYAGGNRA